MTILYKITNDDGTSCHGGSGKWPLPNGKAGKWRSVDGDLVPCSNGLHLCCTSDVLQWLGPAIWEAEHDGEIIEHGDKVVARKARLVVRVDAWNEQTARLFAADCAGRVLHLADDKRCDAAVLAARQYAFGMIDSATMVAAEKAARAATGKVPRTVAWDAAIAAAWTAAQAAPWTVAWAAAGAAAWTEAGVAAGKAAQTKAGVAECAAAAEAARAEAHRWQQERLVQYLTNKVDIEAIRATIRTADH
jgi:hypothetical protein